MSDSQQILNPNPAPVPPTPKTGNGLGTAALVIGIIAFVGSFIPFLNYGSIFIAVIGLVLGIVGLVVKNRPRKAALAGTIISGVALILSIILAVAYTAAFVGAVESSTSEPSTQPSSSDSSGTNAAPSKSWYDDTYGKYTTVTKSGTSDNVITLPAGAKGGIVTATYSGSSNFILQGLDSNNKPTLDLLVDTIGRYSGTSALGLNSVGNPTTSIKVTGKGSWTVSIAPFSSAASVTIPTSGKGDKVFLYDGKAATWTFTNKGSGNFIVSQNSQSPIPNLGIDEIGNYSGTIPMDPGPSVVVIKSDGIWSIK
ncbi:MAG TPA: hypothetical protein VGI56_01270 [Galbitalea sp.]